MLIEGKSKARDADALGLSRARVNDMYTSSLLSHYVQLLGCHVLPPPTSETSNWSQFTRPFGFQRYLARLRREWDRNFSATATSLTTGDRRVKSPGKTRAGDEKSRVVSPRGYLHAERAKHGGTCLNLFDRKTTRGRRGNVAVQNSSHQLATFARPTSGLKSAEVSASRYSRGNPDSADPRSGLRSRRLEIAHPEKSMLRMLD
ncbi:hypothetical protein EAG_09852 [Camponotus floridanus]|uniref:Uncharacterized protein n=1 Tax=Camponotus floridanus TaxID=104421 RepID=E1ZX46_CAMFO|nr:hypothetical protein EAG_09852 [Camponotus floridanus]